MAELRDVIIPDIGGAEDVDVIEIMVAPGDSVSAEDSLVTLESDKASMEIPAPFSGVVKTIKIVVGDKVSEGDLVLTMEVADSDAPTAKTSEASSDQAASHENSGASTTVKEVNIPDIGGAEGVDVIEIMVAPGDTVAAEDSLVTLESDKASMEIPAPFAGVIKAIKINVGDKVSEGDLVMTMVVTEDDGASAKTTPTSSPTANTAQSSAQDNQTSRAAASAPGQLPKPTGVVLAGPGVRRLAREFGVDLAKVGASGPKGRITKTDVQNFVKAALASGGSGGFQIEKAPNIDFAKFGEIEIQPLNKIKKLTGKHVHRSWVTVPHVTQFGDADITAMEKLRKSQKAEAEAKGVKMTPLVYIMKAVVSTLKALPIFNTSLDPEGENLIYKRYYHIGIAADTPNGLVVPVIRDVDQKSLFELADELAMISKKAREKGLTPAEMSGSTFTISSLGGIGGTAFTPIVKAPDVAILGVSRASIKPVYQDEAFVPRLMLPLSLSYDHRVVDGADGARFIVELANQLAAFK